MDGRTDDADRGRCSIIDDRDEEEAEEAEEEEEVEHANPIKCCIQESSTVRTSAAFRKRVRRLKKDSTSKFI